METNYQDPSKKKVKGVAKGKFKDQSGANKFKNALISDDVQDIKSYVIWDMILPAVRDGIRTVLIGTVEALFGGRRVSGGSNPSNASYISYNRVGKKEIRTDNAPSGISRINDIVYQNRAEATDVLDTMRDVIDQYEVVTVNDLWDIAELPGTWTGANYGWTDLTRASVVFDRGDWRLSLPRPIVIR